MRGYGSNSGGRDAALFETSTRGRHGWAAGSNMTHDGERAARLNMHQQLNGILPQKQRKRRGSNHIARRRARVTRAYTARRSPDILPPRPLSS